MKRVIKSSISIRLASVCIGFVSSVLVNRALGLELRGTYTTVYTYATLLQSVLNLGVAFSYSPLTKEYGKKTAKAALTTVIWIQTALCVVISAICCLVLDAGRTMEIAVLTAVLVANGQIVFLALLEDIRSRNMILLASAILYCIGNVLIMVFAPNNFEVVFALLVARLVFETAACAKRGHLFVFDLNPINGHILLSILRIGIPTALLAALIQCNYNIDVVIMNALGSDGVQIGIFGVAYTLSNMLWFIPDAFKELVYYDSARNVAACRTLALVLLNMVICFLICVLFAIFGADFLSLMYGEEYRVAFQPVMTVFIGIIPMVVFKLIHPIYVNSGRSQTIAVLLLISVGVNSIAAISLIPGYGAFGAALATVLSYSVCGILVLFVFMRDYGLSFKDFFVGTRELLVGKS